MYVEEGTSARTMWCGKRSLVKKVKQFYEEEKA
jgi:hypothetical protein